MQSRSKSLDSLSTASAATYTAPEKSYNVAVGHYLLRVECPYSGIIRVIEFDDKGEKL